ncbi:toll/interleukin-1 receptor domain-containing protein [Candidatus Poriferisodalis sp.]|uniref:toll/interleukin-1 receptor domain-containing protein n=1 Tax=Candidatus Poriferisodalis sp. TaxID=3101277 RepID=UPI003B5ACD21
MDQTLGEFAAFLSYAHFGDEYEDGRIADFRRRLSTEVKVQTGRDFPIFYDRDNILVGQQWRERIEASLDSATFLIVIMTPLFFQSAECENELKLFLERERQLGRNDLIVPIHYIGESTLSVADNPLIKVLLDRQYFDATDLRFEPFDSPNSRRLIASLATHIVAALRRDSDSNSARSLPSVTFADEDAEGPGFLELLAAAEEAMPQMQGTLESLTSEINAFGTETQTATQEMQAADRSPKPAAAKLIATRKLKARLEVPVSQMERLAAEYQDQLMIVGAGVDALIEHVRDANEEEIEAARGLLNALDGLVSASSESFEGTSTLRNALSMNYSLSATLRPTLRRMANALELTMPSRNEFIRWRKDLEDALSART